MWTGTEIVIGISTMACIGYILDREQKKLTDRIEALEDRVYLLEGGDEDEDEEDAAISND